MYTAYLRAKTTMIRPLFTSRFPGSFVLPVFILISPFYSIYFVFDFPSAWHTNAGYGPCRLLESAHKQPIIINITVDFYSHQLSVSIPRVCVRTRARVFQCEPLAAASVGSDERVDYTQHASNSGDGRYSTVSYLYIIKKQIITLQ